MLIKAESLKQGNWRHATSYRPKALVNMVYPFI